MSIRVAIPGCAQSLRLLLCSGIIPGRLKDHVGIFGAGGCSESITYRQEFYQCAISQHCIFVLSFHFNHKMSCSFLSGKNILYKWSVRGSLSKRNMRT